MTGGQDHPGTGRTLRGEATHKVDYETICRACGVEWVRKIDPYEVGKLYQTLREAIVHRGVSVVIASRPCVLDPVKIKGTPLAVNLATCVACQACINLGCPSITWADELLRTTTRSRSTPPPALAAPSAPRSAPPTASGRCSNERDTAHDARRTRTRPRPATS